MAKYDQGGGCSCGLYKECVCELHGEHDWRSKEFVKDGIFDTGIKYQCQICKKEKVETFIVPEQDVWGVLDEPTSYSLPSILDEPTSYSLPSKWDKRYMKMAALVSTWSKDPSSVIGAVAVNDKGQILSTGYNGFPRRIEDDKDRLNHRETKYKLVVHAEMNAIYNATYNGVSLDGSTFYVSGLPTCSECAKGLIQVGVKRVVMNGDPTNERWVDSVKLALQLFKEAGVEWAFIKE